MTKYLDIQLPKVDKKVLPQNENFSCFSSSAETSKSVPVWIALDFHLLNKGSENNRDNNWVANFGKKNKVENRNKQMINITEKPDQKIHWTLPAAPIWEGNNVAWSIKMNTNFKELYVTYKQNGIENFPIGWWQSQAWLAKLIWFLESLIQSYSAKSTTAT